MKITGAAPKIAIPTFIYMLLTIIIHYQTIPLFTITERNYAALSLFGIIMIMIGAMGVVNVSKKLLKSFKEKYLMTDGLFNIVRNPMYVSYLLFIIPGICLLFNSWLVLTTVIVNLILFQIFIKEEYRYLEEKYGDEYRNYLRKVWVKFL